MRHTFILVPGAWHTACSWFPVARRLRTADARAEILELPGQRSVDNEPLHSVHISDAVAALVDHVRERDLSELVLVGHSLGGYVIGGALSTIADRVERVIYYASHIPVAGVSMADAFPERMAPLCAAAGNSPDGSVPVPSLEVISQAFAPGASPEFQRLLGDLLVPTPGAYFMESVERPTRPSEHGIEFSYILGEQDLILPPPAGQFPAMLGVEPVLVPGGHEALFTDPDPLARTLLDIAR